MKAYHVLMFIYILTISINMIQGVGFFNPEPTAEAIPYDENLELTLEDEDGVDETFQIGTAEGVIGSIIAGLGAAIGLVLLTHWINPFNRSSSDIQIAAIAFFGTTFWGFYLTVLNGIQSIVYMAGGLQHIALMIFLSLTAIVALVFGVGMYQILTGGWKSFE